MNMRIWVILCYIYLWTLHGINVVGYCGNVKPVIHACTNSIGSYQNIGGTGVYVNTGAAQKLTANKCMCTIIPNAMKKISLTTQGHGNLPISDEIKFMFEINNMTLNDSASLLSVTRVEINGETELVYSSTIDFVGGYCLSIAPTSSNGTFSIKCVANQNMTTTEGTTSSRANSTDTVTEPTVSKTQTKPSNDANPDSETNITLIAIISGSVGGVVFIAVMIISILCCKSHNNETTIKESPISPRQLHPTNQRILMIMPMVW